MRKSKITKITKAVKQINTVICALPNYHNVIPLKTIFDAIEKYGLIALQEDNTPRDGFLCGDDEHASIALGDLSEPTRHEYGITYPTVSHTLELSWYKMLSGRYEIVAYIS